MTTPRRLMGSGPKKEANTPGWEEAVSLAPLILYVDFEGMRLPVLSLRYEAEAYRTMGRTARAEEIERYIREEAF